MPAASMPTPYGGPWKKGRKPSVLPSAGWTHVAQQRDQHEDAPEAVDDAGHRRQQLDQEARSATAASAAPAPPGRSRPRGRAGTAISSAKKRRDQRAVDERQRAEALGDRDPTSRSMRKREPNVRIDGAARRSISNTMPTTSSTSDEGRATRHSTQDPVAEVPRRGAVIRGARRTGPALRLGRPSPRATTFDTRTLSEPP